VFEEKHASSNLPKDEEEDGLRDLVRHNMFEKGQSKRIWGELYKVLDSSDVVVQVSVTQPCILVRIDLYSVINKIYVHLDTVLRKCEYILDFLN
jgi:nuclear GTP-binding protein